LVDQTRANQRSLSNSSTLIQNVPLGELRRRQRQFIGHSLDEAP
jgi:hypothetical protein